MIFVNQETITEDKFVALLGATKTNIETAFKQNIPNGINGNIFEDIVYDKMTLAAANTEFAGHIEQTGAHAFPDIIARKLYGVEVKMTIGDKWVSTGNSVLETTRVSSVETIFMFFGKFGKSFEVKYRKYQECLSDVGVTHSPRYKIDMNLAAGHSIFDKIKLPYDSFRKDSNSIKLLKEYYIKQLLPGEELWWIDPIAEETSVSPIIKSFRLLDEAVKDRFIIECMILFPEIFGYSTIKFDRCAAYLITNYNSVSSNMRDNFTAGGTVLLPTGLRVSRILFNLYERAKTIQKLINFIPSEKLSHHWSNPVQKNREEQWFKLLSQYSVDAVKIYKMGLNHEEN
jgi:hypothetical protein